MKWLKFIVEPRTKESEPAKGCTCRGNGGCGCRLLTNEKENTKKKGVEKERFSIKRFPK